MQLFSFFVCTQAGRQAASHSTNHVHILFKRLFSYRMKLMYSLFFFLAAHALTHKPFLLQYLFCNLFLLAGLEFSGLFLWLCLLFLSPNHMPMFIHTFIYLTTASRNIIWNTLYWVGKFKICRAFRGYFKIGKGFCKSVV